MGNRTVIEDGARGPRRPTRVLIEPARGWLRLNLRELWQYRELLYFLVWRDLTVRYKQTVLGFLWAFIQPFFKMVVFSVIFGGLAQMPSDGAPYPIFLYAGLLPWHFFSQSLSRSSDSIVHNSGLVTKVYFPRLIIPLSSIGATLADFAIAFLILVGLMLYYGVSPTPMALLVIPLVLATIVAALSVGIILAAVNVAYRDFRLTIPFLLQIWLFVTPVIYPASRARQMKLQWVLWANPMSGIVDGFRSALLGTPMAWGDLGVSLALSLLLFFVGLMYFRRVERTFADII